MEKKLIQLRTKLEFNRNLSDNIQKILDGEIDIENFVEDVYRDTMEIEDELSDLKINMNLSDERWDEDESNY